MLKKVLLLLVLFLTVSIGVGAVKSDAKMMKKMKMKMFFMRHSLGFVHVFYKYHPGPMWILKNAKALNLTTAQINSEKALKKEMFQKTKTGIKALKGAMRQYKMAAKQDNPNINGLIADVRAAGNAESYLGYVMIPYHIKAYRLLNASQRIQFNKLAKMNWKKMMIKMRIMHKIMMIHTIMKGCHRKLKMLHRKLMMLNKGEMPNHHKMMMMH